MEYEQIITLICAIAPAIAAIVTAIGTAANANKIAQKNSGRITDKLANAVAEIKEASAKIEIDKMTAVMQQSIADNAALKKQIAEQRAEIEELKDLVKADLEKTEKKVNTTGQRSV